MQKDSLITSSSVASVSDQLITNRQLQKIQQKPKRKQTKQRLNSLDVHRGLTMLGMILVDNVGPQPLWWTDHVQWNGLSPADLVFPSFVFIMGMAVPLAVNQRNPIKRKTIIRVFALILIGVFLQFFQKKFNIFHFRILGILQRLGVCYGATILTHVLTNYGEKSKRIYGALLNLLYGIVYLAFMIPFENESIGCPRQNNLTQWCNFGAWIDRGIFGEDHMIYPNDPQGLFTNLNAFITAYIGYYFSLIMFDNKGNVEKMLRNWIMISILLLLGSYPLTFLMPYNKKLWSSSYTLGTAGIAGLVLAFLVITVDILPQKKQQIKQKVQKIIQPFVWLGRNPLAIFVMMNMFSSIIDSIIKVKKDESLQEWFYYNVFQTIFRIPQLASIFNSLFYAILWTCVGGLFFKWKIFIRL